MASLTLTVNFDSSDMLEALKEAAALTQRLGNRLPPHIERRRQEIGAREGGFYEIRTETGRDGQITVRMMAGHELLCLLADLRAQQPA